MQRISVLRQAHQRRRVLPHQNPPQHLHHATLLRLLVKRSRNSVLHSLDHYLVPRRTDMESNLTQMSNLLKFHHPVEVSMRNLARGPLLTITGHMQHPPFAYPPTIETQWPPTAGFLPSSSVAEISPSSSGYWRPSPSTANSTYGSESNISGGHTPATINSASNMSYSGHHDSPSWGQSNLQPPTRSMSYGNIEGIPQQYSSQGLSIQQHDYPRRTSPYPFPATIDTNPSTIRATTLGGSTAAPLSAPILPNQQYTYPQTWSPYGGHPTHEMPMQSRSMSGQWYAEPGQLDQVQEEGGPPMTYNHHGMQQFYSGP